MNRARLGLQVIYAANVNEDDLAVSCINIPFHACVPGCKYESPVRISIWVCLLSSFGVPNSFLQVHASRSGFSLWHHPTTLQIVGNGKVGNRKTFLCSLGMPLCRVN